MRIGSIPAPMHALDCTGLQRSLEPFRAEERRWPTLAAVHLAIGMAWCVALSVSGGAESVTFALLMAVALARAPSTIRLYGALFRCLPFQLYFAWVVWQVASNLWSVAPVESWAEALVSRRTLALIALWPLAARWRELLAALCSGALLGAVAAAVAVAWHGRLSLEAADLLIAKYRSSAGPLAAAGIVAAVAVMMGARSWALWWGALVALGFYALQLCALAGRAPALGAAAGVLTVLIRSGHFVGAIPRRYTLATLAAGLLVGGVVLGGPLVERFSQVQVRDSDGVSLERSNIRMVLWREAWNRGWERPIVGHGALAWRGSVGAEIAKDPGRFGVGASQAARLSQGNHAHNTLLGAWYGTGAVGVALLVGMLASVVVSLWRAAPRDWAGAAALGITGVYLVAGIFDDLGNVSVGGFLVALLVLFASVNALPGCRRCATPRA